MRLHLTILTAVILLCYNSASAQNYAKNGKIYNTWIRLDMETSSLKVNLYDLCDSTISISYKYLVREEDLIIYPIEKIQLIEARRKGKVWKGLLFGYLGGMVVGAIIGYATAPDEEGAILGISYDDFNKGYYMGMGSLIGGGVGLVIGGLIGAAKIKMSINGSRKLYREKKQELKRYSYQ